MLRRKLLIMFGSVVAMLVALAVLAVLLLQRVMSGMDHVNRDAMGIVAQTSHLNTTLSQVEIELYGLQLGRQRHLDELIQKVDSLDEQVTRIRSHYVMRSQNMRQVTDLLDIHLTQFRQSVASLATAQDPDLARQYIVDALGKAMELRRDAHQVERAAHQHASEEQLYLATSFRWLVLGLTLGCMIVVNVVILALLHASGVILRPVDRLVRATRELARERFDHRVKLDQRDEFQELAESFNSLAERLETNEQRKMEVLHQVTLALNHEINNVIATVDLQLRVLARQAGGNQQVSQSLRQIQDNLRRIAQTVQSLKDIRRIVLTEYVSGVQMLDLQQSLREADAPVAEEEPV